MGLVLPARAPRDWVSDVSDGSDGSDGSEAPDVCHVETLCVSANMGHSQQGFVSPCSNYQ